MSTELKLCALSRRVVAGAAAGLVAVVMLPGSVPGRTAAQVSPIREPRDATVTPISGSARFEANRGQSDPEVQFLAHGTDYALFLTASEAVVSLKSAGVPAVVRMRALDANPAAPVRGIGQLPGLTNYFRGEARGWVSGIPSYSGVRYDDVYPGVDLVYHGNGDALEYDFVVNPGSEPSVIGLGFEGVERTTVDAAGDLILSAGSGSLRQRRPHVYQDVGGSRRVVAGDYVVEGDRVRFSIGDYDPSVPLVIDPVLSYSSYLGSSADDRGRAVAVDPAGAVYVTGETFSADFPVKNPAQPAIGSNGKDAFVTKLERSETGATTLVYSTYLGGSADDSGLGIAVDGSGNAWVTGETQSIEVAASEGVTASAGFPIKNGFQTSKAGTDHGDAFVAMISTTTGGPGSLAYSTYLGGPGADAALGIALAPDGTAWVTGQTVSTTFPVTAGALKATKSGSDQDVFLAHIDAQLSGLPSLLASTYLGGTGHDSGNAVAVDADGNPFVTGQTRSANFPVTAGASQAVGGNLTNDAFVSRLGSDTGLLYSTYLGGTANNDAGNGIGLLGGRAYVTGQTFSNNFPVTAGAFQPTRGGVGSNSDAFLSVIDTTVTTGALRYSSYLGGTPSATDALVLPPCACLGTATPTQRGERGTSIAVGGDGRAYIGGETNAFDFPTSAGAFQATKPGPSSDPDGFVASIDPSVTGAGSLVYGSYLGGQSQDLVSGAALSPSGRLVLTGDTESSDFPLVAGALQLQNGGGRDAFVSEVDPRPMVTPSVTGISPTGGPTSGGTEVTITGTGLAGVTGVKFGDLAASSFSLVSDTELTAVSPPHAQGAVFLTVAAGPASSFITPGARFFYGDGGVWTPTDDLATARYGHTATLLRDGRVLVAGGSDGTEKRPILEAEMYNARAAAADVSWSSAGSLGTGRSLHTATLLGDGTVLVAGGIGRTGAALESSELFDPAANAWTVTDPLVEPRFGHTATLLPDGRVLVVGGSTFPNGANGSAEIYDPLSRSWTRVSSMTTGRYGHTATLLASGKVLVVGGSASATNNSGAQASAEIYDPAADRWASSCPGSGVFCSDPAAQPIPRVQHSATMLPDGKVLLIGGRTRLGSIPTASAELFDPAAINPKKVWLPAASLAVARYGHAAVTLGSGRPLVVGGSDPRPLGNGETFNFADDSWQSTPSMLVPRGPRSGEAVTLSGPTATVLSANADGFEINSEVCGSSCGKVLVVGGSGDASAELFTPAPTVDIVTPSAGPPEGRIPVSIIGTGFTQGLSEVRFGDVPIPEADRRVESYFKMTVTVPASPAVRSVDVVVVTEGGASSPGKFTWDGPPDRIDDLGATAISTTEIRVTFSAPGSNGDNPPAAARYVVTESLKPITDDATFDAAYTLCGGACVFSPRSVGDKLTLSVTNLSPGVTYHYAVKAEDETGDLGPLSNPAHATTTAIPSAPPPSAPPAPPATAPPPAAPPVVVADGAIPPAQAVAAAVNEAAAAVSAGATGASQPAAAPAAPKTLTAVTTPPVAVAAAAQPPPGAPATLANDASSTPVIPEVLTQTASGRNSIPLWVTVLLTVSLLGNAACVGIFLTQRYRRG